MYVILYALFGAYMRTATSRACLCVYLHVYTTCVERILQSRKLESEQRQRKHQKKWRSGCGYGWDVFVYVKSLRLREKRTCINSHRISSVELNAHNEEFRSLSPCVCFVIRLFCSAFLSNFRIEIYIFTSATHYDQTEQTKQTKLRKRQQQNKHNACNFFAIADGNGNGVILNGCFMVAVNNAIMQCSAGIFCVCVTLSTLKYQFLVCVLPILIFLAYSLVSHHYLYFSFDLSLSLCPISISNFFRHAICHSILAQFFSSFWVCTMANFFCKKKWAT